MSGRRKRRVDGRRIDLSIIALDDAHRRRIDAHLEAIVRSAAHRPQHHTTAPHAVASSLYLSIWRIASDSDAPRPSRVHIMPPTATTRPAR